MLFLVFMWVIALTGAIGLCYFLFKIRGPVSKVGLLRMGLAGTLKRGG